MVRKHIVEQSWDGGHAGKGINVSRGHRGKGQITSVNQLSMFGIGKSADVRGVGQQAAANEQPAPAAAPAPASKQSAPASASADLMSKPSVVVLKREHEQAHTVVQAPASAAAATAAASASATTTKQQLTQGCGGVEGQSTGGLINPHPVVVSSPEGRSSGNNAVEPLTTNNNSYVQRPAVDVPWQSRTDNRTYVQRPAVDVPWQSKSVDPWSVCDPWSKGGAESLSPSICSSTFARILSPTVSSTQAGPSAQALTSAQDGFSAQTLTSTQIFSSAPTGFSAQTLSSAQDSSSAQSGPHSLSASSTTAVSVNPAETKRTKSETISLTLVQSSEVPGGQNMALAAVPLQFPQEYASHGCPCTFCSLRDLK